MLQLDPYTVGIVGIVLGALLLLVGAWRFRENLRLLAEFPSEGVTRLRWLLRARLGLLGAIFVGYVVVLVVAARGVVEFGILFVGITLLIGATFVLIGIVLQARMLRTIRGGTRAAADARISLEQQRLRLGEIQARLRQGRERQEQAEEMARKLRADLLEAERMRTLGMLAGGIAHDLNNILSGLVGYPDLLLAQAGPGSPLRPHLETVRDAGERAARIVQDLLTMTRGGAFVAESVSLNRAVEDAMRGDDLRAARETHPRVEVLTDLDAELLPTSASPDHLVRVVTNLAANGLAAIGADQEGVVTIHTYCRYLDRPETAEEEIPVGEYAVLEVSDTGPALSPEERRRIFEPFYARKTLGREGTGLEMAAVRTAVKDHGGYLDVDSRAGEGTTIRVYLVANREAMPEIEDEEDADLWRGRGESILVVDDVDTQREIAREMLEELGYRVTTLARGEEAIEAVKEREYDLLVLDMIMDPGMNGLETYAKVLEIRLDQKAVLASGYTETELVRQAQELGAGSFVRKPYRLRELGQAVRVEIDGR